MAADHRSNSENLSDLVKKLIQQLLIDEVELTLSLNDLNNHVRANKQFDVNNAPNEIMSSHWLNNTSQHIEHLQDIIRQVDEDIQSTIVDAKIAATSGVAVSVTLLVIIMALSPVMIYLIYRMTRTIQVS